MAKQNVSESLVYIFYLFMAEGFACFSPKQPQPGDECWVSCKSRDSLTRPCAESGQLKGAKSVLPGGLLWEDTRVLAMGSRADTQLHPTQP